MSERGTSNPGLDVAGNSNHNHINHINHINVIDHVQVSLDDDDEEDENPSGCFHHHNPLSPDSEYDEDLAFPDSVTILSIGGDNPILVERKDDDAESLVPETEIPFTTIYKPPIKFKSLQRKVFIPGQEIHVQIIDNERSITTHLLNPNLWVTIFNIFLIFLFGFFLHEFNIRIIQSILIFTPAITYNILLNPIPDTQFN